ncbi:MAG: insulinase family protein [Bdellovibrionota bacterium]
MKILGLTGSLVISFFIFQFNLFAQQSSLQSIRPIIFSKPVELNWRSVSFDTINYSETSLDGGASLYSLPNQTTAKFSLRIALPKSIYSMTPQERTAFGAMADLLILGGFSDKNFEQIQNLLSENGINLETGINQNGQVVISANALSSDFDLVLTIMQEMLFSPKFSSGALDIWKQQSRDAFVNLTDANTLEKQMRFVDNQANILALGENQYFSTYLKRISPTETSKVTIEKVKEIYKQALNKNGLNVWLSGNYTQKNFVNLSKLVAEVPKTQPSVYAWLPERPLSKNQGNKILAVLIKKPDMTQCNVTLRYFYPNLGKLNDLEEAEYSLISEVFSSTGGVIGNDRFSKVMRTDSGISYSPHAYFNQNILYPNTNLSAFYLNFQSPNERLAEAVKLAKQTWNVFLTKGIQKEELDVKRTSLMNRLLATESTIFNKSDSIMEQVMRGEVPNNNPIEYSLVSLDQLKNVTRINHILSGLAQEKPLAVLVIMGNPDAKQISTLLEESGVSLVNTIDFNSFIHSL